MIYQVGLSVNIANYIIVNNAAVRETVWHFRIYLGGLFKVILQNCPVFFQIGSRISFQITFPKERHVPVLI